MKLIYDDIIYSLQKSGGGSVYWTEITKRITDDVVHYAYDNAETNIFYDEKNFKVNKKWSSKFLILKRYLNLRFSDKKAFIFHSSLYRYCKNKNAVNITTVHDFTYEYFRKDFKAIFHKIQKKNAVMHSAGVICISENTKEDLLKFYPKYKGYIKVIYNGFADDKYFFDKNVKKTQIVLFVGARNDYKRFDLAVHIVSELKDCKLIIIGGGKLTESEEDMLNSKLFNRYEKKNYVSDEELRNLYSQSFFLCYPSEYEGFGIPLIEAQACGCPVICQAKSSIPEVVKNSAIYINAEDVTSSLNEIKKLYDIEYYSEIVKKGLENSKRFSWSKCAQEVKQFYEEVCNHEKKYD